MRETLDAAHTDLVFMGEVIDSICRYARENNLEPNDTIKGVADNLLAILDIASFSTYQPKEE